ncbi:RNA 2',3'-cyclic phosphodiesterase [Caloramator sp. E03]|uniref:RNA 2',3'-cyclic phosphodiesterase n=1 Tax=Caloramator sp. E03 TaxID=2576307 RepID=UPI001110385C|nr:RNA 2',3'-cyclic phosphodiesterase [Caloramator sp. E03]QCX32519.1 RNA 2',3'-cyclic phosphodiesterase [Caloramator sp. E03]
MRTFITLEFDKDTKDEIVKIQKFIKDNSFSGRFKYIDNFHLTLKFLGETDLKTIELIYEDLNKKLKDFKSFKLNFSGIGAFGINKIIRTVFIKAKEPLESIQNLYYIVDEITSKYGFKSENKYIPHVTIAQDVELKVSFQNLCDKAISLFNKEILFDKIVIMKSEQINGKRIYTPLKVIFLNK